MAMAKVLGLIVNKLLVGTKTIDDMTKDELRVLLGHLENETCAS